MRDTKKLYVTMTDKFMSGWGLADNKINKLVFEDSFTKNRDMKYFFQCVDILKKDFEVDIQKSYYNQKHNGVKGYWGGFIDQIIYCKK